MAWLTLALGTCLVPGAGRLRGSLGVAVSALAVASLPPGAGYSPGFLLADASLLLVGCGLGLAALVPNLRAWGTATSWERAGALLLLLGTLGLAWAGRSIATLEQLGRGALVAGVAAFIAIAGLGLFTGSSLERRLRVDGTSNAKAPGVSPLAGVPVSSGLLLGALVGAVAALIGPHLWLLLGGAMVSGILLDGAELRRSIRRPPIRSLLLLTLVPFAWLLTTIAGPTGLMVSALPSAPLSEAAEVLLVSMLVLPAWALSGAWPFPRGDSAALLAPVGWALLARLGHDAMPDGVRHWAPVLFPLVAIGVWHGAISRNSTRIVTGLALLGSVSAGERAMWAGGALALMASIRSLRASGLIRLPKLSAGLGAVLTLVPVWAGLEVLRGALGTQVLYSVLIWAGLVVASLSIGYPEQQR